LITLGSIRLLTLGFLVVLCAPPLAGQQMSPQGAQTSQSSGAYSRAGTDQQDKSKDQVSDAEFQAFKKVESGKDVPARLKAAADFLALHPKSSLLKQVAESVAAKIAEAQDLNQKIGYAENYLAVFKEPAQQDVIVPPLIDAYVKANRLDDAFKQAAGYLERNPNDVPTLTNVTLVGVDQARRNNTKFVPQIRQYGARAIELIEAGNKPELLTDAQWTEYKTKWLPLLYQQLGLLAMVTGDAVDAKAKLEKSISLNPSDPFSYYLMGGLTNDEYQKLASQYKSMLPGPDQDQTLKRALAEMDLTIDFFAHSVALSDGVPAYLGLHDALMPDLEKYYKYRHKDSTEGLQQLIDKYKKH
jgi:hypothetical protein